MMINYSVNSCSRIGTLTLGKHYLGAFVLFPVDGDHISIHTAGELFADITCRSGEALI